MGTIYTMKMLRKITTSNIKWGTAALGCDCGQCNVYIVVEPVLHASAYKFKCYLQQKCLFLRTGKKLKINRLRCSSIQRRTVKHSMKSKEAKKQKKKHKNEHTPVDISYYVFNFGTIVGEQRCARIQRLRSHDRIFHDNVRYKHIWLLKTSS